MNISFDFDFAEFSDKFTSILHLFSSLCISYCRKFEVTPKLKKIRRRIQSEGSRYNVHFCNPAQPLNCNNTSLENSFRINTRISWLQNIYCNGSKCEYYCYVICAALYTRCGLSTLLRVFRVRFLHICTLRIFIGKLCIQ